MSGGGYYKNSYKAIMNDLQGRRRFAERRRSRWLKNNGEVGCYPDLVLVVRLLDRLIEAADEAYALENSSAMS